MKINRIFFKHIERVAAASFMAVVLGLSGCGPAKTESPVAKKIIPADAVRVASKIDTEGALLGNMIVLLLESKGIETKRHEFLTDCLEISGAGDIAALEEYKNGLFYVQDAAARLAVLASGVKSGDTVLDACSAPGGKSFASALMMQNMGKVLSCDIHKNKLIRVREGADRLGIDIITTDVMDAAKPDEAMSEAFDLVIADVPCSGLGVIRKKPDIRYKDLKEIEKLPETQLAIIEGLSKCVKSGGILLYSTCTVLKAENVGVVDCFLSEHKEFSAEGFELPEPIGRVENGCLNLYPHIHHTDGFFICKLRKHNES